MPAGHAPGTAEVEMDDVIESCGLDQRDLGARAVNGPSADSRRCSGLMPSVL
ncbi:hypothetical protein ACFPKZ_01040 [Streptosporangium amethystogenes subsp. fukuiense]|uniref:hypothetical protein n=1 Tax=Streptosporangium amethystogenes TaxID=2002 RepID=UPI0033887DED